MEVKIAVQNVARELVIDSVQSADDVQKIVSDALTGESGVLTLVDSKGRTIVVPTEKLAFVEIGSPTIGQVGFRS